MSSIVDQGLFAVREALRERMFNESVSCGNGPAPVRSVVQRRDALRQANDVRFFRARLKRDLRAGRACVLDVIAEPPADTLTMKVFDLLLAVPWFGRVKVEGILSQCRISPVKTLGGLSARQRDELVGLLVWRLG